LEAHRSGLSVHRIAQIFRERGVDISVPHLVRTVRRFMDEEERAGKGSPAPRRPVSDSSLTKERHQELGAAGETKLKAPVTYQIPEQSTTRVQEEEFAKQLRLARYLAGGGSPPSRRLEAVRQPRTPKRVRSVTKARPKTETGSQKAREEELAKERRRAAQVARRKASSSGSGRSEKQRSGPSR